MTARFGPAGASNSFYDEKNKGTEQMPNFLVKHGLNAFEYQCGRGVNIGEEKCIKLNALFKEHSIALSLHAPYFINFASDEAVKRDNSIDYLLQAAKAAKLMGAKRVVFHPGSIGKNSRSTALATALQTFKVAINTLDDNGFFDITLCPETMGKMAQLGDLEETIQFCLLDERVIPCIDFGHLNARTQGGLNNENEYAIVLETIKNKLGEYRYSNFHSHFSKIEYTKGGEKKHLTFADEVFGPKFEPLAELVAANGLSPIFICESDGTQTEDAKYMQKCYEKGLIIG